MQETAMRMVWTTALVLLVAVLLGMAVNRCHARVIEGFDDEDVPDMFKTGRRQQADPEEGPDEFDHMADPEDTMSLDVTEFGLSAWEGGIALELYGKRPDIFAKLRDWYESDVAYDLDSLEKELIM